ncbi:golvesin C-terminal-like domain-containing protein [Streptomyces sp. NPDC002513]
MTSAADSDGLHVLVADSKDVYAWRTAAVLAEPGVPADTWIGNQCLIDPSHAAVVYAPRTFADHEDLMLGGAFAAVVDLDKGTVTKLPFTASLAYFDPSCNPATRTAAFTAFRDDKTRLITVDAAGRTAADTTVTGQVTSAVPVADGTVAALYHHVVHISRSGATRNLAATDSVPFDLRPAADGTIAFLDRTHTTAHAKTLHSGRISTLATGGLADLSLQQAGTSSVFLAGHPKGTVHTAGTGVTRIDAAADTDVSTRGLLAVDPVLSPAVRAGLSRIADAGRHFSGAEPAAESAPADGNGQLTLTATATATGQKVTETVAAPAAPTGTNQSPALTGADGTSHPRSGLTGAADTIDHDPVDTDRWCSVPRNDINTQALQPTPNQVEWAVDMAVRGDLTANWITQGGWRTQIGLATIDPQALFPVPALTGGGRIPAQVELGVLAQESNLWQAEPGAIPGQMGNPLASTAGFYGHSGPAPNDYWKIDWTKSDCGYGVGQITDGMRMAGHEKPGETALDPTVQRAVALDYTVNVAASLQILADKWNEVHTSGQTVTVNNDDPSKPENWFAAVWNYNLGFNRPAGAPGVPWGLGWYDNPANPIYPPSRQAFMDTTLDSNANHDAAHPQDWPYEEKVMGWAAWSIDTGHSYGTSGRQDWPGDSGFSSAGFQPSWWLSNEDRNAIKPPLDTFCTADNACDIANPPPCETQHIDGCDQLHWWNNENTVWKPDCADTCGHESIKYQTLRAEPGRGYRLQYGTPDCTAPPAGSLVVHSVPAGTNSWSDCGTISSQGTFQFTFSPDTMGLYEAKGDLHQIGGGYQGHFWYAHARDKNSLGGVGGRMTVLGQWKLNSPLSQPQGEVFVHIPDTGAQATQAVYQIDTAYGPVKKTISQRANASDKWVSLGAYRFNTTTPAVSLSNTVTTGNADDDIAWDAVAFVPGDYGLPDGPAIDLTLPDPDTTSPNPDQTLQAPDALVTPPLAASANVAHASAAKPSSYCGPVRDGRQVCFGPARPANSVKPKPKATLSPNDNGDWCDTAGSGVTATRRVQCSNRIVPVVLIDAETQAVIATAEYQFTRELELSDASTFVEYLTVTPISIPPAMGEIRLSVQQHLCGSGCTPNDAGATWSNAPVWIPGDSHSAELTTGYSWDNTTAGAVHSFTPDFLLEADVVPATGNPAVQVGRYQWGQAVPTRLDEVRCDTVVNATGGCVFVNYAPTFTFNAGKYPQAAAHAWLVQSQLNNHPGSRVLEKPLYYMPGGRDGQNRAVICDESGWAAANGDPAVLSGTTDSLSCDEFAGNATYNSGGMPADQGGLNPVFSGGECLQTYATKVDATVHLYNIGGYAPQWTEVCGRSSISGLQNSGSMSQFGGFATNMRLLQRDAYWLDTGMFAQCSPNGRSLHCAMVVTQ